MMPILEDERISRNSFLRYNYLRIRNGDQITKCSVRIIDSDVSLIIFSRIIYKT